MYEYAVCKAIEEIFEKIPMLNKKLAIIHGTQLNFNYRSQIVIRNWTDIMPDADFVVVDLSNSIVKAIISCKTNLRERLTETAYWKRELQSKNIEYIYHNR